MAEAVKTKASWTKDAQELLGRDSGTASQEADYPTYMNRGERYYKPALQQRENLRAIVHRRYSGRVVPAYNRYHIRNQMGRKSTGGMCVRYLKELAESCGLEEWFQLFQKGHLGRVRSKAASKKRSSREKAAAPRPSVVRELPVKSVEETTDAGVTVGEDTFRGMVQLLIETYPISYVMEKLSTDTLRRIGEELAG